MKKLGKKSIIIVTMVLMIVSAFAFGIYFYDDRIENSLTASTETTLAEIAQQQQYTANVRLQTEIASVKSVAKSILMIGENQEKITNFIYAVELFQDYENITIINNSRIGVNSSGEIINLSELDFLDSVYERGNTIITEPYTSNKTGQEILYIATPISESNNIEGALVAEIPIETLRETILPAFEGKGYNFIIDNEGNIITATENEYTFEKENFFVSLEDAVFAEGYLLEKVKSDVKAKKDGHIVYEINGEGERIAEYRPLNYNDWYIVNVIPEDVIAENANIISRFVNMYNIQTIIICVLVFAGILIIRKRANKDIEKAAYYDELTNIPNMNKFKIDVAEILKKEKHKRFTIVKFDVVNFKAINEILDFETGDKVIKVIADMGRNAKIKPFAHARVGTDEFLMFGPSEFYDNLEKLRVEYESQFNQNVDLSTIHNITFRYGRYSIPVGSDDINDIVNKAVLAHTYAKKYNEVISDYDEGYKKKLLKLVELTGKMEEALESEEFKVYVQPKYGVKTPEIVGGEALVRWQEKNGKFIFPDEFIPLFEENGFIVKLDMYMLENVCKTMKRWINEGKKSVPISINFSRLHITNESFVDEIEDIANKYEIPRNLLEIELTENTIIENEKELIRILEKLHASGFTLSMDDFGSGHSSLGMLRTINVDTIKMDKTFFDIAKSEEKSQLIVASVLEMSHKLGIKTVAEGVETQRQIDFLKSTSCDVVQGYFYAKPMPIADFEELLNK